MSVEHPNQPVPDSAEASTAAPSAAEPAAASDHEGDPNQVDLNEAVLENGEVQAVEDDLAALLTAAELQRDEYLDLARRTKADFENFRRRAAKDMQETGKRAIANVMREFLPVIDNIERAMQAAETQEDAQDQQLSEGIRLVAADLHGILTRLDIKSIEPHGELFDPNLHEAITTQQRDGVEAGTVVEVAQRGYILNETVLRPARVVVSG